jgi:hypothetical protein
MALPFVMNGQYAVGFTFAGTVGGARITSPNLDGKLVLQSADHSKGATNERTHDENGAVMVSAWLDPHDKATLEHVIRGDNYADVLAQIAVIEALPLGTLLTIAECASMPGLVATSWEAMDIKVTGTNTGGPKKCSFTLEYRPQINAVITS